MPARRLALRGFAALSGLAGKAATEVVEGFFECAGVHVVDFGVLVHQQGADVGFAAGGEIAVFDLAEEGFGGVANGVERFDELDVGAEFFEAQAAGENFRMRFGVRRCLRERARSGAIVASVVLHAIWDL